jgi:hypothetical protein
LFFRNKDDRHELIATIAAILYQNFESVADKFQGFDDESWSQAMHVFMEVYPAIGDDSTGMNPLQQQLAVKLINKLRENMDGTIRLYRGFCWQ